VGCGIWREAISARLDGEDVAASGLDVDAHLAGCAECRAFEDDAVALTRLVRIGLPVPGDGVPDSVLDVAPGPGRSRLAAWLRGALVAIGAGQLLLGIAQLASPAAGGMTDAAMGAATPEHLAHEYAAWNLALGAAFLFVAVRRTRPAGLLPLLTVFVAVLTAFSVGDALDGTVAGARLATHALVLGGYLIVAALSRPSLTFDGPTGARRDGRRRWRLHETDDQPISGYAPEPRATGRDEPAARRAA
jgi:predicted anti-sigma-YlaC factor YlaD